jgi:hypothetical protein
MDGHTYTRCRRKIRVNGVPRSATGTEKVNGKNRQSKGMNPDGTEEDISSFGLYYIS